MQSIIMVLNESINNTEIKNPEEKTMSEIEKNDAHAAAQKLYSCEELERSIGLQLTGEIFLIGCTFCTILNKSHVLGYV